jgi:hypothetical protein
MTANFDQARVELDQALFLRMANAKGVVIVCLEGCLWITQDGSSKDTQLNAGQRFVVEDASRVIVTGFEPSLARLLQPITNGHPSGWRLVSSILLGLRLTFADT